MSKKRKSTSLLESVQEEIEKCVQLANQTISLRDRDQLKRRRIVYARIEELISRREAQRHIDGFLEWAANVDWQSIDAFCQALALQWWRAQEKFYGNFLRPHDETLCDESCVYDAQICSICTQVQLYGCYRHGTLHHCTGSECASLIKTDTWDMICMFSGTVQGRVMSSLPSVNSSYKAGNSNAGFHYAMSLKEFSLIDEHNYRGVVNKDSTILRRRQGSALELYDKDRERRLAEAKSARKATMTFRYGRRISLLQKEHERKLRGIAEQVLRDMLFDKEARLLFNETEVREAHEQACAKLYAYHARCKTERSVPNMIDSVTTFVTPICSVSLLPLVEYDRIRQASFATLCTRLWSLCHRSPYAVRIARGEELQSKHAVRQTTCTFAQFCLSVLYVMREGLFMSDLGNPLAAVDQFQFVPLDRRLVFDLPAEDHVDAFGERARTDMQDKIQRSSTVVRYGNTNSDAHQSATKLFKSDGTRMMRKKRRKRRTTTTNSGAKRVNFGKHSSLSEQDVLPPHLHTSLMGETGVYEKNDITRGRGFLRACLHSLDSNDLEKESGALRH